MTLGSLPPDELSSLLKKEGLRIPCGPFSVVVRSSIPEVGTGLSTMYGDFPVLSDEVFIDFEVTVGPPSTLRRIIRPQAGFFCDGRTPFKPLPRHQAFPMLEWGLNWVISTHAHDYLVLHAAVLERNQRALIISADPGSGKSTLCAGLVHAGWRLLSDELALLDLATGHIRPIARPISLKNRSIDVIRALGPDVVLSEVCPDTTKGAVAHVRPPADSVHRRHETALPAWLLFPKYCEGGQLSMDAVGKATAFMEMVRHAFNYGFLGADAFDALAAMIDRCDVRYADYGSLDQVVPALEAWVSESST